MPLHLHACVFPLVDLPRVFSIIHRVCPPPPSYIPCVAFAVAAGSGSTSARLGSYPSRWPFWGLTRHIHKPHKLCLFPMRSFASFFTSLQHLSWSKGSEMMNRVVVDSCIRVFSGWPQPQSQFPYFPACLCARRAAASSGTQYPIFEPPPSLEVIAPTLDAPGQPPTKPPSLARE